MDGRTHQGRPVHTPCLGAEKKNDQRGNHAETVCCSETAPRWMSAVEPKQAGLRIVSNASDHSNSAIGVALQYSRLPIQFAFHPQSSGHRKQKAATDGYKHHVER